MSRWLLLMAGIALGIGVMLWWDHVGSHGGPVAVVEDDDDARESPGSHATQLVLTPEEISLVGLELVTPVPARLAPEVETAGRVADAADLLSLLRELHAARTAADAADGIVTSLADRLARLRALSSRGEIMVARELAALELDYRRERLAASARAAQVDALDTALLARWGAELAALVRTESAVLAPLEAGDARLIAFVADMQPPGTVHVAADGQRAAALPAQVLGAAATTLGGAAGRSFFALAQDERLRVGMALTVWLPTAASPIDGVMLPASALVWHHGAQWYYATSDGATFDRHPLGAARAVGVDFLVPAAQAPSGRIVIRGAQALLAEEYRDAIPEEDDD